MRVQFLDAGMLPEQRGGLLRQLRTQGHALLHQAADQFRIGDVGRFDRPSGFQHAADSARTRVEVGFLAARGRKLRGQFGQLLIGKAGAARADEQIGLGAEILDIALGFGDAVEVPSRQGSGVLVLGGNGSFRTPIHPPPAVSHPPVGTNS